MDLTLYDHSEQGESRSNQQKISEYERGRADFKQECIEAMPELFFAAEGDSFTEGINEGLSKALTAIESVSVKNKAGVKT